MKFVSSSAMICRTGKGVKKIVTCVKTFTDEYQALSKLQEVPGVIKLLDVNTDTGTLYMDYHPRNLLEHLMTNKNVIADADSNKLYTKRILKTFIGLVETVNACHSKNIIHCDLKPDNILLDADENPILIDFGHAIHLETSFYSFVRGTDGYQAPEMKLGHFGYFTDVYSLGVLLYTLLLIKSPKILPDGDIDFNFNENEKLIPHELVNLIVDMTEPYYERRPTTGYLLEALVLFDKNN